MRNGVFSRRGTARRAACFFLAAIAAGLASCNDLGGPIEWATYTIVYHANDGSGGVVSTTHRHGDTHNLRTGVFDRVGYTFEGWSRDPHWAKNPDRIPDDRPEFADGDSVSRQAARVDDVINLFAVWIPYTFTVIYNANNATCGEKARVYIFAVGARLSPIQGMSFIPPPHLSFFGGWAMSPDGQPEFVDEDLFFDPDLLGNLPLENGGTIRLYARWLARNSFTIVFDFNSGTDAEGKYYEEKENEPAGRLLWLPNEYGLQFPPLSRANHFFDGWNAHANGSGNPYRSGDRFIPTDDTILYAQWRPIGATFTVAFNANNAAYGTPPPPQHVSVGNPYTELPGAGSLSRPGHNFIGWSSRADGLGAVFPAGHMFRPTADTTLYASWFESQPLDIPWVAVAVGVPTTTSINFNFAAPVTGLATNDITITSGTGTISTGALTMANDGRSGSLAVTAITNPGNVYVSIGRQGIAAGSQSVVIFNNVIIEPDIPWAAVAIGVPHTTSINFAFATPVTELATNNITVTSGTGAISTGALTMANDGRSGSLAVTTITTPGNVHVSIDRQGIAAGPQSVVILEIIEPDIPWVAVAIGAPHTTYISFAFAAPVTELVPNDITVTGGTGAISTGALTMAADGRSGSLEVTAITNPGNVQISIGRQGIVAGPQSVEVFNHVIAEPDIPWAAVAVGIPYTTHISFAFAVPVTELAANNITVTGGTGAVTTGALAMAPDGRSGSLAVTAITNPGNVQISIDRQGIAVGSQSVVILEIIEPDIPWVAVAIGATYTTSISFAFAAPVTELVTNDITVTGGTGAISTGALTMAADGRSGSLEVTEITTPGNVQISIGRQGIVDGPQSVEVFNHVIEIPWAAVAVGTPTTTAIRFIFGAPVSWLTASNIMVTGEVSTGALTMAPDGRSGELEVTAVTIPGSVTVTVSIDSLGVASEPQTVEVIRPHSGNFTISFADFQNAAPYITGPTVGLFTEGTITVMGQFHSIEWWQGGGSPVATGPILVLGSNIHRNQTGTHHVTVVVMVNRGIQIVPYSRIVRFEVRLN